MAHRANRTKHRIGSTVTAAAVAAVALCPAVLSGLAHAAPQQEAKPTNIQNAASTADSLTVAGYIYESVKVRFTAGVATRDELEQAQAALNVAQASARLSEARVAFERQRTLVKAGLASIDDSAASQLAVTEDEVALYQAQIDQQQLELILLQKRFAPVREVDAATWKIELPKMQLRAAKVWRRWQRLSVLETRLFNQKKMLRAGIASQSDVDKAQAEYDAAAAKGLD